MFGAGRVRAPNPQLRFGPLPRLQDRNIIPSERGGVAVPCRLFSDQTYMYGALDNSQMSVDSSGTLREDTTIPNYKPQK